MPERTEQGLDPNAALQSSALSTGRSVFPTPLSSDVHTQLARIISVGAADFFHDACALVSGPLDFHAKSHLIAHLAREIVSAVRAVVSALPGVAERATELGQDPELHDAIAQALTAEGIAPDDAAKVVQILATRDEFQSAFTPNAKNTAKAALEILGLEGSEVEAAWNTVLASPSWHKHAHRAALGRPRGFTSEFLSYWSQFLEALQTVLSVIETRFSEVFRTIAQLKEVTQPSKGDCRAVAQDLPRVPVVMANFFNGLGPEWVAGLHKKNLFSSPPQAIRSETEVRFPAWPQGKYLKNIAADQPDKVCEVILSVRDTDNVFVHADLIGAALKMPPPQRAKVLEKELHWVQGLRHIDGIAASSIEEATERLVEDENVDLCVGYLQHALSFTDEGTRLRPGTRLDDWHYERLVRGAVKKLSVVAPLQVVGLLRRLIVLGHEGEDSSAWRSAIEDHQQNAVEGPLDHLIAALRNVCSTIAGASAEKLREAYEYLLSQKQLIFHRLALWLLGEHGKLDADLVAEVGQDPSILNNHEFRHEAMDMLGKQLPALSREDRAAILDAICKCKSPEVLREAAKADGRELDEVDAQERSDWALLDWLFVLRDHLSSEQESLLGDLVSRHGEPSHPTFGSYWWSGSGDRTPTTSGELATMSDDDLTHYLKTWEPEGGGFPRPDREGLGRELRTVVFGAPERFIGLATHFAELDAAYVWALLDALSAKQKDGALDRAPVIELCESLIKRDENRIHRAIGHFLESALAKPVEIPEQDLSRGWALLKQLLTSQDPPPDPGDDAFRDPLTFAINTTRGRGLDQAVDLFCGLRSDTPLSTEQAQVLDEVRESIRLRVSSETCGPLLSVVARSYNRIFVADRAFAESIASALFMRSGAIQPTFSVFLHWNQASGPTYDGLAMVYDAAIAAAGLDDKDGELGQHLLRLAAWRKLSDDRLVRYWQSATQKSRAHALGDFGRALSRTEELAPELMQSVQDVWTSCREASVRGGDSFEELKEFGWWFVSTCLSPEWRLAELELVLNSTSGQIDWDHKVVEELAALAAQQPEQVAASLRLLVQGCDHGYTHFLGRESLAGALATLLANSATDGAAAEIVSLLAVRGHTNYLQLLPSHH